MASSKEIRTKIKSVQGTRKITKAMEMVAAAKMRKAQERMRMARPYADKIRNIAAHLARANPEYRHPFLIPREQPAACRHHHRHHRQGVVRRPQHQHPARRHDQAAGARSRAGVEAQLTAIGTKGLVFMQRLGANIVSQVTQLGDRPHMDKLIGPVKIQLDAYARRRDRRGLPRLHHLHQHDEAGAGDRAAAAAAGRSAGRGLARILLGLPLRAGRRRACSTNC